MVAPEPGIMKRQMGLLEEAVQPERPSSKRRVMDRTKPVQKKGAKACGCC